ncbi:MAG: type IV toxin-antitoxin system AbiEi family antitoxin domain-containing protein [Lentisphaerae bacterium]|nr:type IV toxin-antitoxin system AbiEi family antitoxin domain-containing protein [Lentisphaerota bacterium]
MDIAQYRAIEKWANELDGVFTVADLKVVLAKNAEATLYRVVADMVRRGDLIKVKRGIYATPDASLTTISSRIEPKAYLSTGTVLARAAAIGSIPARRVQGIKIGRPRTYRCELGTVEHLSISPRLYFGFASVAGTLVASPEKAFLDVCYFTYRGRRFSFDPVTDINLEGLDFDMIERYLETYDRRFVSFFNRIWRRP